MSRNSNKKGNRQRSQNPQAAKPKPTTFGIRTSDAAYRAHLSTMQSLAIKPFELDAVQKSQMDFSKSPYANDAIGTLISRPFENRLFGGWPYIYFGVSNLFPQELIRLRSISIHASLLELKKAVIVGGGLDYKKDHPQSAELMAWLDASVRTDDYLCTIDELMAKSVFDYLLYGTYAYRTAYGKKANIPTDPLAPMPTTIKVKRQKQVSKLYYADPATIRIKRNDNHFQNYTDAFISPDWQNTNRGANTSVAVEVPFFNGSAPMSGMDLYYYRGRVEGANAYPLPSYVGALFDIQTFYELQMQRYSLVKNGFNINQVVTVPAQLTPDEQDDYVKKWEMQYLGSREGNHTIFNFGQNTSMDNSVVLTTKLEYVSPTYPFQTQIATMQQLVVAISAAHGVPLSLVGFTGDSSIGSDGNLLANAVAIWEATQIESDRKECVSGLKSILTFNGFDRELVESVGFKKIDVKTILGIGASQTITQYGKS